MLLSRVAERQNFERAFLSRAERRPTCREKKIKDFERAKVVVLFRITESFEQPNNVLHCIALQASIIYHD